MSDCARCGGWGIGDNISYQRSPCPDCGAGSVKPFTIDKGAAQLVLHDPKWGAALTVWNGAGACSIRLDQEELIALSKALWKMGKRK